MYGLTNGLRLQVGAYQVSFLSQSEVRLLGNANGNSQWQHHQRQQQQQQQTPTTTTLPQTVPQQISNAHSRQHQQQQQQRPTEIHATAANVDGSSRSAQALGSHQQG
jgi:hypothetical protein